MAFVLYCVLLLGTEAQAANVQISHDGLLLNGSLELAEDQTVSDGLIIMLHGTLGHKDMEIMQGLQQLFLEKGRSSLAISLSLGIDDRVGFFPCQQLHTHRNEDALLELGLWMNWAHEQGAHGVVLLGHSRGANQVARYIAETGVEARALVLLAPLTNLPAESATTLLTAKETESPDGISPVTRFLHCENVTVTAESLLSYYGPDARSDTRDLLIKLETPTLLITGSDDDSIADFSMPVSNLDKANIEHVEIDGADHFFRDLYSDDAVDLIEDFLEKHANPTTAQATGKDISASEESTQVRVKEASDLKATSAESLRDATPIILFFSRTQCTYCEQLRRAILLPMLSARSFDHKAILLEVGMDSGKNVVDFDGALLGTAGLAERYSATITPTLLFLDANGREVAKRLVGIPNLEYYRFYLEDGIKQATLTMRK